LLLAIGRNEKAIILNCRLWPNAADDANSFHLASKSSDGRSSLGIQFDNPFNGPTTDGTKVIGTSEHYAINFRPVVSARFINRTLEGAHMACVLFGREHLTLVLQLLPEEIFHLALGASLFAELRPAFLNLA
jgi:hypothetical protein